MNQNVGISDLNDATGSLGSGFPKRCFTVVLISFTFCKYLFLDRSVTIESNIDLLLHHHLECEPLDLDCIEIIPAQHELASISLEAASGRSMRSLCFRCAPALVIRHHQRLYWSLGRSSSHQSFIAAGTCKLDLVRLLA